jgi:hypothetical protein
LRETARHVARIHLVEAEYALAMGRAELAWVRSILEEIRAGRFQWDVARILGDVRAGHKQERRRTR